MLGKCQVWSRSFVQISSSISALSHRDRSTGPGTLFWLGLQLRTCVEEYFFSLNFLWSSICINSIVRCLNLQTFEYFFLYNLVSASFLLQPCLSILPSTTLSQHPSFYNLVSASSLLQPCLSILPSTTLSQHPPFYNLVSASSLLQPCLSILPSTTLYLGFKLLKPHQIR